MIAINGTPITQCGRDMLIAEIARLRAERFDADDDYMRPIRRTMDRTSADCHRDRLAMLAMGLTGEAGEVSDVIKKYLFHDRRNVRGHLLEEIGDVAWYLTRLADEMGFTLRQVMESNLAKTRKRYP